MTPEIQEYFKKKYSECGFTVVPGHWPNFKTKDEVDHWFTTMVKFTEGMLNQE